MKLLVDGDIFAFRCAAAAENEDEGISKYYVDKLLDDCLAACSADSFQIYLTGSTNFRYQVYPEYKQARQDQPRPRHLPYLRDYLVSLGAAVSDGCEADDLLAVAQTEAKGGTIICSLDKDLLQVPGAHYSWAISGSSGGKRWERAAIHQEVTDVQGLRFFYTQMLTGDATDGIKGAMGIGKVKAARILEGLETEEELLNAVRPHFSCDEEMLMNGQCLWLWREMNGTWKIPVFS